MTGWVEEAVASGGYVILSLIVLLENLFPPIPSELVLPLAGSRVASGDLDFAWAVVAATIGSVAGALALYAIGRFGGRPLLLRYARVLRLDERKLDRADRWFDRHGPWIVLIGRVIPIARSVVSVPAGLSQMPVWQFLVLTTVGSAVWNAALIGAGWALGSRWRDATDAVESANLVLCALVAVAITLTAALVLRRRQARAFR